MQQHQQPIQQRPRTDVQFQQRPTGGQFRQQATAGGAQQAPVAGGRQQSGAVDQFQQPSGGVQPTRAATGNREQRVTGQFQGRQNQQPIARTTAVPVQAGQQQVASGQRGVAEPVEAINPSLAPTGIKQPGDAQQAPTATAGRLRANQQRLGATPQAGYAAAAQRQGRPLGQVGPVQQPTGAGIRKPIASRKTAQQPSLQQGVEQPLVAQRIQRQPAQGVQQQTLAAQDVPQQTLAAQGVPQQTLAAQGVPQQSLTPQGIPEAQLYGRSLPQRSTVAQQSKVPESGQQFAAGTVPSYGGTETALKSIGGEMSGGASLTPKAQSPAGYAGKGFEAPSLEGAPPVEGGTLPRGTGTAQAIGSQFQDAGVGKGVVNGGTGDVGAAGAATGQVGQLQGDPSFGGTQGLQPGGTPSVQR